MKIELPNQTAFHLLVGASCLSLALGMQAFAQPQLQHPQSIAKDAALVQDQGVTPAGCCEPGCSVSDGCCGNEGGCNRCCNQYACCPKKVTEEVKKHYWEVKNKMICIPGFRFECNWNKDKCCQQGCGCGDTCCSDTCCSSRCCANSCEKCRCSDPGKPTCGRVRCIKVLEKHDYTCDECGYEWEVKCVRSGNRRSCCEKDGCCCPSCGCASVTPEDAEVQLTAATEVTPAKQVTAEKPSLSRKLMGWLK